MPDVAEIGEVFRSNRPGWRTVVESLLPPLAVPSLQSLQSMTAVQAAAIIRPFLDPAHYRAANPDVRASNQDPLLHFLHDGWREGRDPNSTFQTSFYLASNEDVVLAFINPLLHYVLIGQLEGRPANSDADAHGGRTTGPDVSPAVDALMRTLFDEAYYCRARGDVRDYGKDPFVHFCKFGWREHRNPSAAFDTAFYIRTNADVEIRGLNPLYHYATIGLPRKRPTTDRAAAVAVQLQARFRRPYDGFEQSPLNVLSQGFLTVLLTNLGRAASTMVVSVSHDDYPRAVGGVQALIGQEQSDFNARGVCYLHLSPERARGRLSGPADGVNFLRLIVDKTTIGYADPATLVAALSAKQTHRPAVVAFICHCILGHRVDDLVALHGAFKPARSLFWVHDYSSLCENYNLLRNGVAFCHAPPPASQTCRICVSGRRRLEHVLSMRELFSAIEFDVLAPSETALSVWRHGSELPHRSATVQPHLAVAETGTRIYRDDTSRTVSVNVAFIGHAVAHKGWDAFRTLHRLCGGDPSYRWLVFSAEPAQDLPAGVAHVSTNVTTQGADAMHHALDRSRVDLALILSDWPETFSFATYETLAAGADIITFQNSGNVAVEVMKTGRGLVLDNADELIALFASHAAVRYVELARASGNPVGKLVDRKSSTTVIQPDPRSAVVTKLPWRRAVASGAAPPATERAGS